MRRYSTLATTVILAALVFTSCGGGQIEPIASSEGDEPNTTQATVTTAAATATTKAPTTTAPATTTTTRATTTTQADRGTVSNPLAVGDPLVSGFTYSEFSSEWEGFVSGLVETGKHRWNDDVGRCVVLLGTLTPTSIEDGAVTSGFSTPSVSLIAEGRLIDDDVNECDTSDIEDAGYGWILNAEVTVGTVYPFYAEFFLPGDPPPEMEVIVLGSATGDDSLFYEPTILDTIPTP